jgi:hypothetical protein
VSCVNLLNIFGHKKTPFPKPCKNGFETASFRLRPLCDDIIIALFNLRVIGANLANFLAIFYAMNLAI